MTRLKELLSNSYSQFIIIIIIIETLCDEKAPNLRSSRYYIP
jgi:hypothetical protein